MRAKPPFVETQRATRATSPNPLEPGERAPDISLPDANGGEFIYTGLLDREPLVIAFLRDRSSAFYDLELDALVASYPALREAGARLIAVVAHAPDSKSLSGVRDTRGALPFPLLVDGESKTASWFGLTYADDGGHGAHSARYVVDGGIVVYARVDRDPDAPPQADGTIAFIEEFLR